MVLGIEIILLGIVSIIIMSILKKTKKQIKATLIDTKQVKYRYNKAYFAIIKYKIEGKEYIKEIGVDKYSILSDKRNVGKESFVYVSYVFPNLVSENIPSIKLMCGILLGCLIIGIMMIIASL